MRAYRIVSTIIVLICVLAWISLAQEDQAVEKSANSKPEKSKVQSHESNVNPVVVMKTSMGSIMIELNQEKAPVTVKNFLRYVDEKFYDNTVFHRVIGNFMIQGGGFTNSDTIKQKKVHSPIKNESDNGLKNDRGTIAMARTSDPNSATSQFFVNVVDNNMLNRNDANPGYAVFGKVIKGMEVVDKIRSAKTGAAPAIARAGDREMQTTFQDVPVKKVVIETIRRTEAKK